MPAARFRHLACTAFDAIYIIGGRDLTDAIQTDVFVFNTTTRAWSTLPGAYPIDPVNGLGSDNSCSSVGDTIYVFGGYTQFYEVSVNRVWAFKPARGGAGTWTRSRANLTTGRGDFASVELGGSIYVYGGYTTSFNNSNNWACNPLTSMEVYSPASDSFTPGTPLPAALAEKDDGVVVGGRMFSIGGERKAKAIGCKDPDIVPLTEVFSYDAVTRTWANETSMPDARMRFASAVVGGTIIVFGGQGAVSGTTIPLLYSAFKYVVPPVAPAEPVTVPYASFAGAVAGTAITAFALAAAVYAMRKCWKRAAARKLLAAAAKAPAEAEGAAAEARKPLAAAASV